MPDVIETKVYRLDELSEAAKDNARAWYREGGFDYDWYDAVYEDFRRIADILGIGIKSRTVRLMGGGVRQEPCIQISDRRVHTKVHCLTTEFDIRICAETLGSTE